MTALDKAIQALNNTPYFPYDICKQIAQLTGSLDIWDANTDDDDPAEILDEMLQRVGRSYSEIE